MPKIKQPRLLHRLGIIIMAPDLEKNTTENFNAIMKELTNLEMTTVSFDWLINVRSIDNIKYINKVLNATAIRFDQNVVVSYPKGNMRSKVPCENNFVYKTENSDDRHDRHWYEYKQRNKCKFGLKEDSDCQKSLRNYGTKYYKSSPRLTNLTKNKYYALSGKQHPLARSGLTSYNYSQKFEMVNASKINLGYKSIREWIFFNALRGDGINGVYVVQYFKVKTNSTLYAHLLGTWTQEQSMSKVNPPYPVEARTFLGEEIKVGRCNFTAEGEVALDNEEPTSGHLIDDVLLFLTVQLNATPKITYFNKLGFRTYEGTWTGLLGALVEGRVDVALEPVQAHSERHRDMDFIFPIADTMCNIYIRHQETSTVRDIFLAPFSLGLLMCVLAIAAIAGVLLVVVSKITPNLSTEPRPLEFAEAFLWSTGILCQQGGTWTPPSPAGSTLLIVCLLFAVITYNSYAAFITSVLSVRVASVDTVAAVLHSTNFKIGYIRNSADQMYLMSTKDSQLNAFYIRGYSDAKNLVTSVEEGLERAASEDYAFFAGQRAARSKLRAMSQARGRCSLRELPVPSTKAYLAFPLRRDSPYAKPTLISLLSLRSGGALDLLSETLVPALPDCVPPPGFASARANDVRSALLLLVLGLVLAFTIGITEYSWKYRNDIRKYFYDKIYKRLLIMLH